MQLGKVHLPGTGKKRSASARSQRQNEFEKAWESKISSRKE